MKVNSLESSNNQELNNNYTIGREFSLDNSITIEKEQEKFLESSLGKTINMAIDVGIRSIFPDFIEEQIINVKDNLIKYGLKDGIVKTIDDAINTGKSLTGLFSGKFESVAQMRSVVGSGGLIDGVSLLLDSVFSKVERSGVMNKGVLNTIKQGKNIILNNVERNVERNFNQQYIAVENTSKYINSWKECFNKKDFKGMQREYNKLEKQFKEIAPIENIIDEARTIKVLHNLIKNNGNNFDLSKEQIELVNKFKYIE